MLKIVGILIISFLAITFMMLSMSIGLLSGRKRAGKNCFDYAGSMAETPMCCGGKTCTTPQEGDSQ